MKLMSERKTINNRLLVPIMFILLAVVACMVLAACSTSKSTPIHNTYTPLDYSKDENWFIKQNNGNDAKYDLIFIYGTSVNEPTQSNGVGDVSDSMKEEAIKNYSTVGEQLSEGANVFMPAYRQMSLFYAAEQCTSHRGIIDDIKSKEPSTDMFAALDYYFEHYNKNCQRPFVLAGHSQGSACLQVVLENYFINGGHKEYLKNMIAAYAIGYGVEEKWFNDLDKNLDGSEILHFANGADDYNCVISWNTEGVGDKQYNMLLADPLQKPLIINPLNWKRDNTYAGIEENKGVLIENPNYNKDDPSSKKYIISTDTANLFDAQIDSERGSVVSSSSTKYVNIPLLGNNWGGKSLHVYDGKGYYMNMKLNIQQRYNNFMAAKN